MAVYQAAVPQPEATPEPPRHTMFFRGRPSSRSQAVPQASALTDRELAVLELDKAIAVIDQTMPNLPLDNPAREQLMKSREHMVNARDAQRD